jgi:hypothetical protein
MTLVPDGSADNEVGLASDNGGFIAIMDAAEATGATTSQSVAGGEESAEETGEIVGEVTEAAFADQELEVIAGYRVHPAASLLPLIVGKQFDDFVEAAARAGRLHPAETNNGLLIDGRNRLRVQEELRRRGIEIDVPVVEWQPNGDETVSEHIWSVNGNRRHQTDDQRAANALQFLPFIRRERQERQAATRFGKGRPAEQISSPPDKPASAQRTSREKDAASTVGQFAAMCNIGMHKARQAVALADGIEAGEISSIEIIAVTTGEKRLRDIVPSKRSAGSGKANLKDIVRPEAELLFDVEAAEVDEPAVTEEEVDRRWERFKQPFAVTEHRKLRRLLIKKLRDEQQRFDQ